MRPLATIIHDTLSAYGTDEHGGRVHDLLGTRCDPYINAVLSGDGDVGYDYHCHSNLVRAVMEWGLTEGDVHDVLNVFQVTGLDERGRYYMSPCPAERGDYIEFLAEQDLLMALSTSLPSPNAKIAPTRLPFPWRKRWLMRYRHLSRRRSLSLGLRCR
jgi:uncharacterized protein YcgI (DUF1989 family)